MLSDFNWDVIIYTIEFELKWLSLIREYNRTWNVILYDGIIPCASTNWCLYILTEIIAISRTKDESKLGKLCTRKQQNWK